MQLRSPYWKRDKNLSHYAQEGLASPDTKWIRREIPGGGEGRRYVINYKKDDPIKPDLMSKHGGRVKALRFSEGVPLVNDLIEKELNGSYDYVTKSVLDVRNPEHRRKFYDTHGIDGKLVGIIGRTNHAKPFDESSKHAFEKVVNEGYTPTIGT